MSRATEKHTIRRALSPFLPLLVLLLSLLLPRCAQIVAPTGGPKDTLPPVLLSATPADSTLHFEAQTITFEFNEFIQLQDLQQQMIIAPNPERRPEIQAKLRTLTFTWPENDTLKPNTTYIINMGNAIQDINEGNPLRGFRYVFSTGSYLDSLEIRGKIIDARTGLADSTALVMLYTDEYDSVVTKEKPVYYTRCDSSGAFRFQNLPHDTFKVFALIDGNGDLQYGDSTEAIAFLKHPVVLDSIQTGLVLSLFKEKETVETPAARSPATPAAASGKKEKKEKKKLTFRTSLNGGQQDLKQSLELTFNAPLQSLDSSAILLQEDSTHRTVAFQFEKKDTLKNTVTLRYNWKENTPYRLLLDSAFAVDTGGIAYAQKDTLAFTTKSKSDYGTLILHFDLSRLTHIDSTGISNTTQMTTDSLATDTATVNRKDSTAWQPDSLATDTLPPADSITASTDTMTTTTFLKNTVTVSDTGQLVIELYQDEEMIYSAPLQGDTWSKAYLNPGDYNVRVVKDVNRNGQWDRGCYYCEEQRQPEQVCSIPETLTIRANWENNSPPLQVKFEKSSLP